MSLDLEKVSQSRDISINTGIKCRSISVYLLLLTTRTKINS